MRALYTDFYKRGRNYTPEDFQRVAESAAGTGLDDFFRRYVRGREELDYNAALDTAGLRLDTSSTPAGRPATEEAYLGATFARDGEQVLGRTVTLGALVIRTVPAGTPAYEQGLNAGDEIIAVDGYRAVRDFTVTTSNEGRTTRDFLSARISDKHPGDTLTVTVFRADE